MLKTWDEIAKSDLPAAQNNLPEGVLYLLAQPIGEDPRPRLRGAVIRDALCSLGDGPMVRRLCLCNGIDVAHGGGGSFKPLADPRVGRVFWNPPGKLEREAEMMRAGTYDLTRSDAAKPHPYLLLPAEVVPHLGASIRHDTILCEVHRYSEWRAEWEERCKHWQQPTSVDLPIVTPLQWMEQFLPQNPEFRKRVIDYLPEPRIAEATAS